MRGVTFGNNHTAEDWGLILNAKTLTPPQPKTVYVSVDGRDGDIDLTEALTGSVKYENRLESFTFLATDGTYQARNELINRIIGLIHGRKMEYILDDSPERYRVGRCTVTNHTNTNAYGVIEIECNCEPWLYSIYQITRSVSVSDETKEIILVNNGIKILVPELNVTGSITLRFNNDQNAIALSTGSYKVADLQLTSGNNLIKVEGTGSIIFSYKEGYL